MKTQELRIGNYVEGIGMEDPIRRINDSIQYNYNTEKYELDAIDIQFFKPIPITEEWLLKFGFDMKDKNRLDWVKGAFNLERSNEDDSKFCFEVYSHYIPLDYIHQFQNLYFALTGEELTLK